MNTSDQDSNDTGGLKAEGGPEGVSGTGADVAAEARADSRTGGIASGAGTAGGDDGREPAESQPAGGHDPDAEAGEETVQEARAERDRIRDRHLRLAADFDNYRKRTEDRLRQRWDRAQAGLVSLLLEPLDDLLRVTALEPGNASVEAIVEGVDLVERKFFRVLEEAGVEVVNPVGEVFDPNTMEAMMRVPAAGDDEDDMVERVFQRGYTFRGQLVRPARVSVFKAQ